MRGRARGGCLGGFGVLRGGGFLLFWVCSFGFKVGTSSFRILW